MDAGIFYVLVGALTVAAFARWRGWPAPLVVTLVALAVSFVPGIPQIDINGHLLLSIVLPPLLYSAALDISFVGFRQSLPKIRRLGVGLVVLTAVAVGLVAWTIMPSLTLPGALLLGAIVAPPDAVSAASIGRRLGLPRRIMTVLSGESLVNDATSLTMYRIFAAMLAGTALTPWSAIGQFLIAVGVGIAVGIVFGVGIHQLRMRMNDPVLVGTFGLLMPFGAYGIAEHLLGSGVLAVVAMGLYVGYNSPRTSYAMRQQDAPLWLSADLLLDSFVFAYIGLQLPSVIRDLDDDSMVRTLALSAAVLGVVLVIRPLFIYPVHALARMVQRRRRTRRTTEPDLSWKDNLIISWAGMRGVVTLATALAATDIAGLGDDATHAIIVVAFVVTVGTLLLQGLTLPIVIRRLGVKADSDREEDRHAIRNVQRKSREAGSRYLATRRASIAANSPKKLPAFDSFARRVARVEEATETSVTAATGFALSDTDIETLARGWLQVRRAVLLNERDAGDLNEDVMREMIAALDAEELSLDARAAVSGSTSN